MVLGKLAPPAKQPERTSSGMTEAEVNQIMEARVYHWLVKRRVARSRRRWRDAKRTG